MIERIAAAMYDDNLRQLNAIASDRAQRQGYEPMMTTQRPFAEADEHVRVVYRSYAGAALEALMYPTEGMCAALRTGSGNSDINPLWHVKKNGEYFAVMIQSAKDGA